MSNITNTEQEYIDIFEQNYAQICNNISDVLNTPRRAALKQFSAIGFPDYRHEDFQITDYAKIFQHNYGVELKRSSVDVTLEEVFRCDVPELDTYLITVINGHYYSDTFGENPLPKGVIIGSLAEMTEKHGDIVAKYYNKQVEKSDDPMAHFNTMFAQDGVFMYVPRGIMLEKPIQIINILSSAHDRLTFQRGLYIIEEGATAKVLVCDHTLSDNHFAAVHARRKWCFRLLSCRKSAQSCESGYFNVYKTGSIIQCVE